MLRWGKCHGEVTSEAGEGRFRASERWNFNQDGWWAEPLLRSLCANGKITVHVIYLALKCITRLHLLLFSIHINFLFSLFQFSISWSLTDWRRRQAALGMPRKFLLIFWFTWFFFFKRTIATIKMKFRVLHKTMNSQHGIYIINLTAA